MYSKHYMVFVSAANRSSVLEEYLAVATQIPTENGLILMYRDPFTAHKVAHSCGSKVESANRSEPLPHPALVAEPSRAISLTG